MASNIGLAVLNGLNYVVWALEKETMLKRKGLWQYKKVLIQDLIDNKENLVVNGKKDEAVMVITTYIL